MSEKEINQLSIRLPKDLYARVAAAATDRRMSINGFICATLEGATQDSIEEKIKKLEKRIETLENKK